MTFYNYIKDMKFPKRVAMNNWRHGSCLCAFGAIARDMGYTGKWSQQRDTGIVMLTDEAESFLANVFGCETWWYKWGSLVLKQFDTGNTDEPYTITGEEAKKKFIDVITKTTFKYWEYDDPKIIGDIELSI